MALDPAGRRRQRQELAQRRAKKQKQMLIRLSIVAAVVVFCTVVLIVLTRGGQQQTPSVEEQPVVSSTAPTTSKKGSTTVKLTFGGDLNVTNSVVSAGGSARDFTPVLMDVLPLLAGSDLTTLNFEGIAYGRPYGASGGGSAPEELLQALNRAGVDLLQVANSCSLNKGLSGLSSTLESIRSAGMEPVGAYANKAELQQGEGYVVCNVNGIRIAFVAFTKGMDGLALPRGSEGCVNVLYSDYDSTYQTVDTEGIRNILANAKKANADLIVTLLHWGSEFNDTISKSQEQIVELLKAEGVDAVIGTHSHYVQKMEFDRENGTFIAYCLGDFLGDADRAGSEYSVVLDLQVTKDNKTGETKVTDFSYTPIFTVNEKGKALKVVRIHEAMAAYESGYKDAVSQETYNAMSYALDRIEARINGQ